MSLYNTNDTSTSCITNLKESAKEFKSVKSLVGTALLTAINVISGMFSIRIGNLLRIGFSSVFAGVCAMTYGPLMTGFAGVIADNLKYLIAPDGPYCPLFTINEFLVGFIYGLFFYKKKITLPRVIVARATITIVINLCLTSLWLNILYQAPLFTTIRLVKNVIMFPIDVAILYFALKAAERIIPQNK